jgi:hypothetical protein
MGKQLFARRAATSAGRSVFAVRVPTHVLEFVSGGDEEGGDAPVEEAPAQPTVDDSSNEPSRNFDLGLPPVPEAAPLDLSGIDPSGVTPRSDAEYAANRDAMFGDGHYQDSASPIDLAHTTDLGHTPTAAIDPVAAINQMVPLPEYPPAPPTLDDIHGPIAGGPSGRDTFNAWVDIAQNYQDTASPPELWQARRNDCFNVASLNALTARNPDEVLSLATETRRDGVWDVATMNRAGNEQHVYVNDTPLIRGGADGNDPALVAIYNGTSQLYHPGRPGGYPDDAMQRVFAQTDVTTPELAALRYRDTTDTAAVLGTLSPRQLDDATRQAYADANLHPFHAYQVAGVFTNPDDGRDYAVLRNPWGYNADPAAQPGQSVHPQPIPLSDLNRLFATGTNGWYSR